MRTKRILASIALACGLTVLITSMSMLTACTSADVKKASQAAQDISVGINLAIETKRDLLSQGLITNAQAIEVDKVLLEVNQADRLFTQGVQQWKDGKLNKAGLVSLFGRLNAAVKNLNDHGVLQITNEKARATLGSVTATIAVSIAVIQDVLGAPPQ